jgi:two-component system LytT family sensor kinase
MPPLRNWLLIFGVFSALTVLFADTFYWIERGHGGANLIKALWWHAMFWYAWMALLPALTWNCRRLERRVKRARQIGEHLLAGALFALVHTCILTTGARIEAELLMTGRSWWNLFSHFIFIQNFHFELFSYAAIVCVWHMVDYYGKFKERTQKAAELERQLSAAQLQALKMQLNPHFFFNTLNGIAALNYDDPRTANRMIAKLSELLRITLADTVKPETLLRHELDFSQRYLELEQLRLGDRLSVTVDISAETLDALVPTMLLQPLVENCIRHGIAPFAARGTIRIHAHREGERLHLCVADDGPGLSPSQGEGTKPGIGLSNTRRRLQQLYGDFCQFELSGTGSGWTVSITMPFRTHDVRDTFQSTLA